VPEDVALVGFDDIPEAPYLEPPLTTIRQDLHELGRTAVQSLLELIETPDAERRYISLTPELVVRESCGSIVRSASRCNALAKCVAPLKGARGSRGLIKPWKGGDEGFQKMSYGVSKCWYRLGVR
jgi:hypothetical protein